MNNAAQDNESAEALVTAIARRLKRERERHGVSASELARRAGLAKSTLTQLEAAKGNPSVETLWALAVALGVPFAQLIDAPQPSMRVVRAGEGVTTHAEHSHYKATLLAACPPGSQHNLYRLEFTAGAARHAEPHIPGTIEHLIVANGQLRTGPVDDPIELDAGDYATFPGDVGHLYEAITETATALLMMEYR